MATETKKPNQLNVDVEGYLVDPSDWTEAVAEEFARQEGIELSPLHWDAIRFMRAYYDEHQITADVRHVIKHLSELTSEPEGDIRNLLFQLFPYGYVKQACRIAGMKRPRAWSTG